jgi:hypothetical protein
MAPPERRAIGTILHPTLAQAIQAFPQGADCSQVIATELRAVEGDQPEHAMRFSSTISRK